MYSYIACIDSIFEGIEGRTMKQFTAKDDHDAFETALSYCIPGDITHIELFQLCDLDELYNDPDDLYNDLPF